MASVSQLLQYAKADRISLKAHPDFGEKWVQERISDDTSILGLGDLELLVAEKVQPRAGRLDLLLYDEALNRRYEVELMLGPTDPSHIIRCIEYWDIERRRYPAYDHVAVLVAEDITSRFLNVMSLLAGSIPLIAVQLVALELDGKIVLHFVQVLDQSSLRADDERDASERPSRSEQTDTGRSFWAQKTAPEFLQDCEHVLGIVRDLAAGAKFRYRIKSIEIALSDNDERNPIWLRPAKPGIQLGCYVDEPETWVKRFDDLGLPATLRRGNRAVLAVLGPGQLAAHQTVLRDFLASAVASYEQSS